MKTARARFFCIGIVAATCVSLAAAQGFGSVRGAVKDPSGSVVPDATVNLKAVGSGWTQSTRSDARGEFTINAVPIGDYRIEVDHLGFKNATQAVQITMGSAPKLEFTLVVDSVVTSVEVTEKTTALEQLAPEALSPPVMVSRNDILQGLPGADRMSSLQFITETTPSAFVLHDHLHVRGGHQIDYSIDGVPIPNTNMSSNVGRALDPKDIDEVEINRGGYGAGKGDRTFAQVNILTRSGFDFDNDGDLTLTYGSNHQTNDQLGFGGHNTRFAYYASVAGNRTDLGLEPPSEQVIHNMGSGLGFFTNMSLTAGPADSLRWTASLRVDHFQVPNFPEDQVAGYRDVDQERDSFITFNWVHTFSQNTLLTVSPFYHYNNSQYISGPGDPLRSTSMNSSNYVGGQVVLTHVKDRNNLEVGMYGFYQRNSQLFGLEDENGSESVSAVPTGGVGSAYINDQLKPWHWLTLNAGVRATHFSGLTNENAANPRLGASILVPKLHWVLRAYYGSYYQAPPLYTVGGGLFGSGLLEGTSQSFGFLPLRGERDIQREYGLTIPMHGWILDLTNFHTSTINFLDHDVLGNSNILLPLTTPNARIWGTEASLRSPLLLHRLRIRAAFSDLTAQYKGTPDGGLIAPVPEECNFVFCYLDHDQRVNLTSGFQLNLPKRTWLSGNAVYGSGVLKADGPDHLDPHLTGDIMFGKAWGEQWTLGLTVLNISNSRFPFDVNSSFAGTHFNNPREVIASVRYRFHL